MIKQLILSLTLSLILSISVFAQNEASFEATPCPIELPMGFVEDTAPGTIECGYVDVPEFHAEADGNRLRLAVAIIHANTANPAPDPLFVGQGGPGFSTFDTYLRFPQLFTTILQERDVILVEQRGTFYSEPALTCPELVELNVELLGQRFESDYVSSLYGEAYDACFDRLQADGVNLNAYNSIESAADLIDVADILGYDEINFYGLSYGTVMGQHLLRDYEARIRSVIFDGVVPLESNFITDYLPSTIEAFDVTFESCANDELCNVLYPDLQDMFAQTVTDLNANPVTLTIRNPETGIEYETMFNGDSMLEMFRGIHYETSLIPAIPAFIKQASEGHFEWAERRISRDAFQTASSFAQAMQVAVLCAENRYTPDEIVTEVDADYMNNWIPAFVSIGETCQLTDVKELDDYVNEPVLSDVPALLTSGAFDPVTPPRYADILAGNLSNNTNLVFSGVGHGVFSAGLCPSSIITEFVSDPTGDLNTDCMDDMSAPFIELVIDPTERLGFARPQGMDDVSTDSYASYLSAEENIQLSVIAIDNSDLSGAIDEALQSVIRESFELPPVFQLPIPTPMGESLTNVYQDGTNLVVGYAIGVEDLTAVVILQLPPSEQGRINAFLTPLVTHMYRVDD